MARKSNPITLKFEFSPEKYMSIIRDLENRIERKDASSFDLNSLLATSKIMDEYLRDAKYKSIDQTEKHLIANSICLYLRNEHAKKPVISN